MTFKGADFEVLADADMALAGAEMPLSVNNRTVASWSKFSVHSGDQINIGQVHSGCRGYLAVTGGIDVLEVMGSFSTYAGARIGGYKGRTLRRGDVITGHEMELLNEARHVPPEWIPRYPGQITLRVLPGPQEDYFADSMQVFFDAVFTVSPQADRKGYRLQGPAIAIKPGMPKSIISEPCLAGCIQVPEDGQPIILLGEQTVGGYAKIATVISSDLDMIAQALPGDRVRFEAVDIETAHGVCRQQQRIEMLRQKIVSTAPMQKCAKAIWNTDPEMFCRKIQSHLNQMRQIPVTPSVTE
jgi:antagonist of KipI